MVGWVLAWFGYDGAAEVQSASALTGITIDYIWLTVVFSVLASALLLLFYHLDKEYPQIVKELAARRNASANN